MDKNFINDISEDEHQFFELYFYLFFTSFICPCLARRLLWSSDVWPSYDRFKPFLATSKTKLDSKPYQYNQIVFQLFEFSWQRGVNIF